MLFSLSVCFFFHLAFFFFQQVIVDDPISFFSFIICRVLLILVSSFSFLPTVSQSLCYLLALQTVSHSLLLFFSNLSFAVLVTAAAFSLAFYDILLSCLLGV